MVTSARSQRGVDYRLAFEQAPVGMVVSRHRTIVDCNQLLTTMFRSSRDELIGESFQVLYPSAQEFERIGSLIVHELDETGRYADERIMKREPGSATGELFWCHVIGRALSRADPHRAGIWVFEDLSAVRPLLSSRVSLTPREREVATLLIAGRTSRQIGEALGLSHRTVEVYRAQLMRKHATSTTAELIQRLVDRDA